MHILFATSWHIFRNWTDTTISIVLGRKQDLSVFSSAAGCSFVQFSSLCNKTSGIFVSLERATLDVFFSKEIFSECGVAVAPLRFLPSRIKWHHLVVQAGLNGCQVSHSAFVQRFGLSGFLAHILIKFVDLLFWPDRRTELHQRKRGALLEVMQSSARRFGCCCESISFVRFVCPVDALKNTAIFLRGISVEM